MSFGKNLRECRERHEMTQEQLAKAAGCTQAMIAQCERGSKVPTVVLACNIAEVLGTTCEELMNGKNAQQEV